MVKPFPARKPQWVPRRKNCNARFKRAQLKWPRLRVSTRWLSGKHPPQGSRQDILLLQKAPWSRLPAPRPSVRSGHSPAGLKAHSPLFAKGDQIPYDDKNPAHRIRNCCLAHVEPASTTTAADGKKSNGPGLKPFAIHLPAGNSGIQAPDVPCDDGLHQAPANTLVPAEWCPSPSYQW